MATAPGQILDEMSTAGKHGIREYFLTRNHEVARGMGVANTAISSLAPEMSKFV
jgi:hypothetical protein